MDVAALSMDLNTTKLQMNVGLSVAKKAMNQQEIAAAGLMEMIPPAPASDLGQHIDVSA